MTFRLPAGTIERLTRLAEEEMRSSTNMVEVLVERASREREVKA